MALIANRSSYACSDVDSNGTYLVEICSDSDPMRAVYKPGRGERPLWDFPDGLYRREVAAYVVSEALGWGLVPETIARLGGRGVQTPVGPLVFDYGINVTRRPYEDFGAFHFAIGLF